MYTSRQIYIFVCSYKTKSIFMNDELPVSMANIVKSKNNNTCQTPITLKTVSRINSQISIILRNVIFCNSFSLSLTCNHLITLIEY